MTDITMHYLPTARYEIKNPYNVIFPSADHLEDQTNNQQMISFESTYRQATIYRYCIKHKYLI